MPETDLPVSEYAFPGPLRDQLVGAILSGEKTSTTSLVVGYEREGEPLPAVGDRAIVIDNGCRDVTHGGACCRCRRIFDKTSDGRNRLRQVEQVTRTQPGWVIESRSSFSSSCSSVSSPRST